VGSPFGKAFIIVNRRAGKGTRQTDDLEKALSGAGLDFELRTTQRRHHAVELARQAITDGYCYLVAVGGDGTIHEVVNGMLTPDGPLNPEAVLGVVSAGSGADFARTFGLPDDLSGGIQHLTGDGYMQIDVGRVTFTTDGGEATQWFSNIAESGLGADVVKRAERLPRRLGRTRYLVGFWMTLAAFKATQGTIVCDDVTRQGRITNLVVANGQFFGGGMHVAPNASPVDGAFDVLLQIGSKADYVAAITKVFKGNHIPSPVILEYRAKQVEVTTRSPLRVEADGELLGYTPATFSLVEGCLRLKI
jgi:diacylglycerol kinase (ATP)